MARRSIHYAWVVAVVTFVVILVTAGVRATPGVLMVALEGEFGWSRAVISSAVAINIALFGLIGPFAASVMDRWGVRRVVLAAIALLSVSVALTTQMQSQWQLTLPWGVLVGTGTGVTSMVLAAIIANRWFDERRGLVLGLLSASNATGQLIFLPSLAQMVTSYGWRSAAMLVAGAAAIVFVIVLIFMRDRPEDLGLRPYGRPAGAVVPRTAALTPLPALAMASRTRAFWLLAGTLLRVRRKHKRSHWHTSHRGLSRLRDPRGAVGAVARDDGHLRHSRDDRIRVADGSVLQPPPAVWLLLPARDLAAVPAAHTAGRREQPGHLRRLLRTRLDRHRSANGSSHERSLRSREHRCHLRMDRRPAISSAHRPLPLVQVRFVRHSATTRLRSESLGSSVSWRACRS